MLMLMLMPMLLLFVVLQVRDREEAARISNAYAPEHLIVNVQDAESWLPLLDNAGSVFMGRWGWTGLPGSMCALLHGAYHISSTIREWPLLNASGCMCC